MVDLPAYDEIPGGDFASIEAFLAFQRHAVGALRRSFEAEADDVWTGLDDAARTRFRAALVAEDDPAVAWRHGWWLRELGGRPRAPFDVGTPPEKAERLMAALEAALEEHFGRTAGPPLDLWGAPRGAASGESPRGRAARVGSRAEPWWNGFIAWCREHIAGHVAARTAAAAERLVDDEILAPVVAERLAEAAAASSARGAASAPPRRKRVSKADRRRIRAAEAQLVGLHRSLDTTFADLGPVCGACTRETGGCCSLTVPLIWREADYRLLALGGVEAPEPLEETAGACPFLGPRGCRLPSERRPHVCRSFLCERAEAALGDGLSAARSEIEKLGEARSQLLR